MTTKQTVLQWPHTTTCLDWEQRIRDRRSLITSGPIFDKSAMVGLRNFMRLPISDLPHVGTGEFDEETGHEIARPATFGDASDVWVLDLVAAIFGANHPDTREQILREIFLMIPKKNGKALALDTEVVTPEGFKTIGRLRVGDLVMGADGKSARVQSKSRVFTDHPCFRITFSTGESFIADADHRWVTETHKQNYSPSVKTTAEIASSLESWQGARNHRIPVPLPLVCDEKELPIHPYLLGLWLGDGFSDAGCLSANGPDVAVIVPELQRLGEDARLSVYGTKYIIRIRNLTTRLRRLTILKMKMTPQAYLRGSYSQRLALLQGLMDSDGTIGKTGQAVFTNTNRTLVRDVAELVASLGMKPSVHEKRAMLNGKDCGPCWDLQFWPWADTPVFRLPRKYARQLPRPTGTAARSSRRHIVACERVPSQPVQCISVDNADHQFLIGRTMIPTHNSTDIAGIIMTAFLTAPRGFAEMGILAPTVEVANNAWRPARDMVALDSELRARLHVQEHVRTITDRTTGSTVQVVAAEADSVAGKKWSVTLIDELWLFGKRAHADKMLVEATGGLASRPEGFVLYSTTQSDEPPAGIFKEKLKYARDVRDGKIVDPHFLPILYEFPKSMIDDGSFAKPENLGLVNPNLGRSVGEQYLRREQEKAHRGDEKARRIFYSKHLNVEIGITLYDDGWAGAAFWESAGDTTLTLARLLADSEVVVAGIDGGGLDDLLGLSFIGRERGTQRWLHWSHAWAHEIVLKRHPDIAARLRDFAEVGELSIVNKPGEDLDQLLGYLDQVRQASLLPETKAIGVDAAGMPSMLRALADKKFTEGQVVGISQGWKLNAIIKTVERMVSGGPKEFLHGQQALMAWAVGNAKVVPVGNAITITKQVSGTAKIDPLMATFDAASLMALNPEATRKKFSIHFV